MLVIGNGTVITLNEADEVIENGAIVVKGDQIIDIGDTEKMRRDYFMEPFIDAKGGLIMPGMTNVHTHCYSAFARGMNVPGEAASNFVEILERLWWMLDKKLTTQMVYYSALVIMLENIRNGTTTIIDHHASPHAVGSLWYMGRASEDTGLRSCHCLEVSDRDGAELARRSIVENRDFIKFYQQNKNNLVKATFGMHASFTVSDVTLAACAEVCKELNTGIHVHVAEDVFDVQETKRLYGSGIVERFNKFGLLGKKSLFAHGVHLQEDELELLSTTETAVAHNPESNMGNAVGAASLKRLLDAGVLVGMGTDGYTADMFEGIKVANLLQKHEAKDPRVGWSEVPQLIFKNNRRILANYFEKPIGVLSKGAYADIITIDYKPHTPLNKDNFYGHILFGVSGGMVANTIIGGKVCMRNREMVHIDEGAVIARAREVAEELWKSL